MKLKQEFVLRDIAGEYVLIPIVSADDKFNGIISVNETGAFIWKQLEKAMSRDEIIQEVLNEYEVSLEHATADVDKFCGNLKELEIL